MFSTIQEGYVHGRRVRRQRPDNGVNNKCSFYGLNAPSVASDTLPTNVF